MMRKILSFIIISVPILIMGQSNFKFDMHRVDEKKDPIYVDDYKLNQGVVYVLTVSGTFSIWESDQWAKTCGSPESKPILSSKRSGNGSVGLDPQFTFAQPREKCGKLAPPFRDSYFEFSLDGGVNWQIPSSRTAFNLEHIYVYEIIGDNQPIQVRHRLTDNSNSYGVLNFTLIRKISGKISKIKLTPDRVIKKEVEVHLALDLDEGVSDDMEYTPAIEVTPTIIATDGFADGTDAGVKSIASETGFIISPEPFVLPEPVVELIHDSLIMPWPYRSTAVKYTETLNVQNRFVFIEIWDNSEEDGDTVSLFLNGKRVLAGALIVHEKRLLKVELNEGPNSLIMYAHNLGMIGKNTASIKITDKSRVYHRQLESDMHTSAAIKLLAKIKDE